MYCIFDIETNGLLETVSKIHCLSYVIVDKNFKEKQKGTIIKPNEIIDFINQQDCLVGHNIIRYDIPVLEKLLSIKIKSKLIDTLALSWYLYPLRIKHGLEQWGDELGVKKPEISDWENLSIQDYSHRCENDVKINTLLYQKQLKYLSIIYNNQYDKIIDYLMFKLDCAKEQEEIKTKLNLELVEKSLEELYTAKNIKVNALEDAMPRNIKYKQVSKPNKFYKKDNSISVRGEKWLTLLAERNLPEDYEGVVNVEVSNERGNSASSIQIKDWLYMMDWQPRRYETRKNKAGELKEIPQIYDGEEVCDSIKELFEIEPALENLNTLSIINHRIGIFESFRDTVDENGFTQAKVRGFTNTLRFKHSRPIVNLPGVHKFFGESIRGCITIPSEEYLMCGSDMSSLEDTTKQHYMYFFDPKYVMDMRVPGFDPHLDIAILAGMMSKENSDEFKRIKKKDKPSEEEHFLFSNLNKTRSHAKTVNFAGVYGAGPAKIAKTLNKELSFAKKLHKTYWDRNKSVKQVANSVSIRIVYKDGKVEDIPSSKLNRIPRNKQQEFFDKVEQMWLLNPISGFYYSLRYPKDIFSTLNQGSGVYCFDLWVREVRKRGIKITLQYHDEILFTFLKENLESIKVILKESIDKVNDIVKLNVPLGISIDIGTNYAECH